MSRPELLNNVDHADLRVIIRHAAEFGDAVNQVLVFPTEYEELQREYPIFFRRDEQGEFRSMVLLGLDRDENLFLGPSGWDARYVPAAQQRGPFTIGIQKGEPMVHVDRDHPRISRDEGEPLFLPHGGNAPYLDHVAALLRLIHQGHEVSGPMFAAFAELSLIRPVAVEIQLDAGEQYVVPDLHTIDEERLARLGGAELDRLHRGGFLRAAFMAASSVANVDRLIALKNRRREGR
ncbi:SapC family protein [Sphingosinicella terrae]|uniref:SapC family protein n=1 Tax=Sphingosinicella terrae TaxID=2172047 RepID=UPI000E0D853D|nr:SapC family protein [Sphingosinicella terrae]